MLLLKQWANAVSRNNLSGEKIKNFDFYMLKNLLALCIRLKYRLEYLGESVCELRVGKDFLGFT